MFIGHYGIALAAKRVAPNTSLGVLFAAAQLPDLIWSACLLCGLEQVAIKPGHTAFNPLVFISYPWSHSLLMVLFWSAAAVFVRWKMTNDRASTATIGLLVLSHWLLDWVSHQPDLSLWPGKSPSVGLGLWQSVAGTLLIEGGLYVLGCYLYLSKTEPRDRSGRYGAAALFLLLGAAYLADRTETPPPNTTFLALFSLFAGLLPIGWAAWADHHRNSRD